MFLVWCIQYSVYSTVHLRHREKCLHMHDPIKVCDVLGVIVTRFAPVPILALFQVGRGKDGLDATESDGDNVRLPASVMCRYVGHELCLKKDSVLLILIVYGPFSIVPHPCSRQTPIAFLVV